MSTLPFLPYAVARRALSAYRASGADLPFGDPRVAHGVSMEGYFWRVTDVDSGRVVIALIGVNRDRDGRSWATVGLAGHPEPMLATVAAEVGWADPVQLGAVARDSLGAEVFGGDERSVRVDLGPGARMEIEVTEPALWPHRRFGGSSGFQSVPALNQYWHPWLLGGRVSGWAEIDAERWEFSDARIYGEKNWGREGFPESWWWGQAQGFAERGACVAFAGGQVTAGPLRTEVTGLVVRLPDGEVVRLGNPAVSPVDARVGEDTWDLRGRSVAGWEVEVHARSPLAAAHVLPVPLPSERRNIPGALEHLAGTLDVVVRHRGSQVWAGRSELAGLEHGSLELSAAEMRRRGASQDAEGAPPSR